MTWRKIEGEPDTSRAPWDEKPVLLGSTDGWVSYGSWRDLGLTSRWQRPYTAEYDNDDADIENPTHWQPLPAPPEPDDA